jgi:DinB superfamily
VTSAPDARPPAAGPIVIPDAATQPAAYVAALLRTLGDRDPVEVYARTAAEARQLCQDLDGPAWATPMAPGEWSALQVVGHLLDVDIVYGFRWRLALTGDNPTYPGYDEKGFARLARPAPARLLDALDGLRQANLALLRSLDEADLRRTAVHGEQGTEDVRLMIDKVGGHDLAHLDQLRRTVAVARQAS